MSKKKFRITVGLVILVVSCAWLLWISWPFPRELRILLISPENLRLPMP